MSGNQRGVATFFERKFDYRNHLICLNHKKNTGLKHVY